MRRILFCLSMLATFSPFLFVALLGATLLWKEMDVIGFKENAWALGSLLILVILLIPLQDYWKGFLIWKQ